MPYVGQVLGQDGGPIVVATDWVQTLPDLVAPWVAGPVHRARHGRLRAERHARERCAPTSRSIRPDIAAAALAGLARCGSLDPGKAAKQIRALGIDPETSDPLTR